MQTMTQEELRKIMEGLLPIVQEAGNIVRGYLSKDKKIETKGREIDLVTAADKESEAYIVAELKESFPQFSIVAEEGSSHEGTTEYTWIIDPVDGTTSFAHGFPAFAVSVGLVDKDNYPVLGAVLTPFAGELFYAYRDGGAWVNGESIHVSETEKLSHSLLGTGFPYNRREIMDKLLERLALVLHNSHDIRRTGSAALDIVYVAAGRLDGYYEEGLKAWDTAAAIVILEEAGGKSSKFDGSPVDIYDPQIIVSNNKIHQEIIDLLAPTFN